MSNVEPRFRGRYCELGIVMKVLLFSPHAAVWAHSYPEALVAEALVQQGHEVVFVGCAGLLVSHCIAMNACGVPFQANLEQKKKICDRCKKSKEIIRGNFSFSHLDIEEYVNASDLAHAEDLLSQVTSENILEFSIDGLEVGRIATYEVLLQAKKITLEFSPEEWRRYQASLRNVIVVLLGMRRMFDAVRPARVVVYNALYSVNRIVCRLAEIKGIPQYFLHAGENLSDRQQNLMLDRGQNYAHYGYMRKKWVRRQTVPCSVNEAKLVTDHFLEVIKGRSPWAYSSAPKGDEFELRKRFKISSGQKVICATMSSYDELFAAEIIRAIPTDMDPIFPKQIDWISALINYVEAKPHLFLIIRVHPREFPNKRESVLSAHAQLLTDLLLNLPCNVSVNWPSDNISLYDIANITDVFANAWSSAGEEMTLLGIPVVLYSHDLVLYPPDLNFVGTTEAEYFRQIELALESGWSSERIRSAYRWGAMKWGYATFSIAESVGTSRYPKPSFFLRVIRKLRRIFFPLFEQTEDCLNRAPKLLAARKISQILVGELDSILDIDQSISIVSYDEETACIKREVGRLVQGLYGTSYSSPHYSLAHRLRSFSNSEGEVI